jgi:hypothetical protein
VSKRTTTKKVTVAGVPVIIAVGHGAGVSAGPFDPPAG